MKSEEEILSEIETIFKHTALHLPTANVISNPKGALIQVDLTAWIYALRWVLDSGVGIKDLYGNTWTEHEE